MGEDVKKLSRREFLKLAGVAGAAVGAVGGLGGVLAACGGATTTTTAATTATTAGVTTTAASTATTTAATTVTTGLEAATLNIGSVLSLTDWYSVVDAAEKVDLGYVAKMINDDGGIKAGGKAYTIQLLIEDGKSSLDGNTAAATKLVLDNKVQHVVGPGAFFNSATSPIFEQNKVIHVADYNGLAPGEMSASTPYEFLGLDPIAQQSANLKAILSLYPNVKTITLATEDATYPPFKQAFADLVTRTGLTLAGDPILFSTTATDYNPVATKIKAQNADGVWLAIGIPPSFGGICKGLRTLGYKGPIGCPVDAPTHIALVGPEGSNDLVGILSKSLDDPNIAAPLKAMLEAGDPKRQIFGLAPNALYMLRYAIEAADSIDPTAIRDKWQSMTTIPTLYGDGFPTGSKLYGLTNHAWAYPVPVCQIMNAKIIYKPWINPDVTP